MKKIIMLFFALSVVAGFAVLSAATSSFSPDKVSLSAEERKLFDLINAYRASKGLIAVPYSPALSFVAQTHVKDLSTNRPDRGNCNMHSWSNKGTWTACCYTDDHKEAKNMWNKPAQLTGYKGNGFEIATMTSAPDMSPDDALKSWKSSSPHNAVIINEGIWKKMKWSSLGVGIYKNYAVAWFSDGKE